jgi:hypothetical protein
VVDRAGSVTEPREGFRGDGGWRCTGGDSALSALGSS